MKLKYLNDSIDIKNLVLPNSDKIQPILQKNNSSEIFKAIEFLASNEKFLYIHGFMGTGKRQFVNYLCEFLHKDVVLLEYYCKESTVCDDILLYFTEVINKLPMLLSEGTNAKITALNIKLKQQISSIKKPFVIVLHSFDDILEENVGLVKEFLTSVLAENNIKLILTTRAMIPALLGDIEQDRKIFLKALTKENFTSFLSSHKINVKGNVLDDFYKYTRGYYYYIALSIKIMQAMKLEVNEFLQKFNQSGMYFDSYLGVTYVNLVPTAIRNFFWFLRTIRHGITLNALAVLEIYDEFAIKYLKTNLMIFEAQDSLFVQDYFLQKIDISIPTKTEVKLHKYIVGIYEEQLKTPIKYRSVFISRQAMRAEIEYHNARISAILEGEKKQVETVVPEKKSESKTANYSYQVTTPTSAKLLQALSYINDKKYTEAIEALQAILENETIDLQTLVEARLNLAKLYKITGDNRKSCHYYELVETYYKQHNEFINLNYLYYDMTDLYFSMYKNERAIETIKKVIYSVDTPQSLLVSACILLGNIYSDINQPQEAYSYYKKALESLDENVEESVLSELYFKYALANDESNNFDIAFEFYNKCIFIVGDNPYKASAYSNLASCYEENGNFEDAKVCYKKAYDIEKMTNNYDGIYYNSTKLAKLYLSENPKLTLEFLTEAKKSAEFLNENFYMLESSIALGDFYYNKKEFYKEALVEYLAALSLAHKLSREVDLSIIQKRIDDMKLRLGEENFTRIENEYANRN